MKRDFNVKRLHRMIKSSQGEHKIPAIKSLLEDKKMTRSLAYRLFKEE